MCPQSLAQSLEASLLVTLCPWVLSWFLRLDALTYHQSRLLQPRTMCSKLSLGRLVSQDISEVFETCLELLRTCSLESRFIVSSLVQQQTQRLSTPMAIQSLGPRDTAWYLPLVDLSQQLDFERKMQCSLPPSTRVHLSLQYALCYGGKGEMGNAQLPFVPSLCVFSQSVLCPGAVLSHLVSLIVTKAFILHGQF